jgi:hypothetical protein
MDTPRSKPRKFSSSSLTKQGREVIYREFAEKDLEKKGYLARELVQCGMPLTKPEEGKNTLQRKSGNVTVTYASGIDPKTGNPIGLPYGPIARLLLVWINTEATKGSRRIQVTSNLTQFMRDVGLQYRSGEKGTTRTLREQIRRLLLAQISFYREEDQGAHESFDLMTVSRRYDLWWSYKDPEQTALFDSWIELGEGFYEAIIENPIPIKLAHLKALRKSPLAIDFYVWASYRIYNLNQSKTKSLFLPLPVLQHQLGSSFNRKIDFQRAIAQAIGKVKGVFPHLDCDLDKEGLTLRAGILPLADPDRQAVFAGTPNRATRTRQALETRRFDEDTLLRAKGMAPGWDVKALAEAYFEWVDKMPESQKPKNVRAHFLSFCRTHAAKNR